MIDSIKNFVLQDHFPTQFFLYSVPIVNVVVRTFQSYHSLDNAANTDEFRIQKKHFKKHIDTTIDIQLAIHAVTLAVAILFPPAVLPFAIVATISSALALSNLLTDSIWRSRYCAPIIAGSVNETGW